MRWVAGIAMAAVIIGMLWYGDNRANDEWRHRNLDPRRGHVEMSQNESLYKTCDGTTLLYYSSVRGGWSISPVANSQECAP